MKRTFKYRLHPNRAQEKALDLLLWQGRNLRSRPFFIGLLTGQAAGVAVSFVVDCIWFPGQGHQIHSW